MPRLLTRHALRGPAHPVHRLVISGMMTIALILTAGMAPVQAQVPPASDPPTTPPTTSPPTTTPTAPTSPPTSDPSPNQDPPPSPPPLAESPTSATRPRPDQPPVSRAPRAPTTSTPARDAPVAPVVVVDDPRVLPELGAVGLDSPEYNVAVADYLAVQARLDTEVRRYDQAVAALRDLTAAQSRRRGDQVQATRRLAKATARLDQLRSGLRDLAVTQYVQGGLAGPPEESLDLAGTTDQARRRVLVDAVQGDRLAEVVAVSETVRSDQAVITTTTDELAELERRQAAEERARDQAAAERDRLTVEQGLRRRAVADTRLMAAVVGLDFPLVVLNAYVKAAKIMATIAPECGIRWQALAGIGRTESRHGTYGDSAVDADGNVSPPIYGIALDGSNGTAVIGDTDLGLLDSDSHGDRATGPMQFIPSTWVRFARDASGDGRADPQNMYDAALTAAVYLCRQGPGLDGDDGLRRAFLSYNHDSSYAALVLERTHGYDEFVVPPVPGAPLVPAPRPRPRAETAAPESPTSTTSASSTTTVSSVEANTR